jgi:predicted RNA methylase
MRPPRAGRPVGLGLAGALLLLSAAGCAREPGLGARGAAPDLAPYVPTPIEVVERMLELAEVTREDVVYDLGSGDGRIVIHAATRRGARGVGVEIDPALVALSTRAALREGVGHLVRFLHQDALTVDLTPATVVTLYLSRDANLALRPALRRQLRAGARVVSHAHDMGDWAPARVERVISRSGHEHTLYLWRVAR